MSPDTSGRPMDGVRVLELGTWVAGPHAATLWGDFGAEVVKVESPSAGDPARSMGATHNGVGVWWLVLGRNKKSVTLNLRTERGRELLLDLVAQSDILLENMRPGRLDEMGLDAAALWERNPGLIIVRVSAFGQTGPLRDRTGYDPIAQAYSGLLGVTGHPDGVPVRAGMPILDYGAATLAAFGGLLALYHRKVNGGRGQEVDMSLYEAALPAWADWAIRHSLTGYAPTPAGNRHPDFAPGELYPTSDGRLVQIVAIGDPAFVTLCGLMNRPDLAKDERYASNAERSRRADELYQEIVKWSSAIPARELVEVCTGAGLPVALVNTVGDLMAEEHARVRGNFVEGTHPAVGTFQMQGVLPALSGTPGRVERQAPELGQDTEEILGGLLGLPDTELRDLRAANVI